MKKFLILPLALLISACASSPEVMEYKPGVFVSFAEFEFNQTDTIKAIHEEAEQFCARRGQQIKVAGHRRGYGGPGMFSQKHGYTLTFQCV